MNKKLTKKETKPIVSNIPKSMFEQLSNLSEESMVSKAALIRQAIGGFLDGGVINGQVVMNTVLLSQKLQELKDIIPENHFNDMARFIQNIMKIEGGD